MVSLCMGINRTENRTAFPSVSTALASTNVPSRRTTVHYPCCYPTVWSERDDIHNNTTSRPHAATASRANSRQKLRYAILLFDWVWGARVTDQPQTKLGQPAPVVHPLDVAEQSLLSTRNEYSPGLRAP